MIISKKKPMILYEEYGSREDVDIYIQRVKELEVENNYSFKLFIKVCSFLIVISMLSLIIFKYNKGYLPI
ncbi:hypothetical protein [Staphylococcus parequorum]|uniref:hypothetical protein n=1 Tax=Staphylococcus sp. S9 TaxID=3135640 RepID=UPI003367225D